MRKQQLTIIPSLYITFTFLDLKLVAKQFKSEMLSRLRKKAIILSLLKPKFLLQMILTYAKVYQLL